MPIISRSLQLINRKWPPCMQNRINPNTTGNHQIANDISCQCSCSCSSESQFTSTAIRLLRETEFFFRQRWWKNIRIRQAIVLDAVWMPFECPLNDPLDGVGCLLALALETMRNLSLAKPNIYNWKIKSSTTLSITWVALSIFALQIDTRKSRPQNSIQLQKNMLFDQKSDSVCRSQFRYSSDAFGFWSIVSHKS